MKNMNRYAVTFTETKRYNPATQTVEVETHGNSSNAEHLVHCCFGSFNKAGLPSEKSKICIKETVKLKKARRHG